MPTTNSSQSPLTTSANAAKAHRPDTGVDEITPAQPLNRESDPRDLLDNDTPLADVRHAMQLHERQIDQHVVTTPTDSRKCPSVRYLI